MASMGNRWVNDLIGEVTEFKFTDNTLKVIHVKFDNEKAGKMGMQRDNLVCQNSRVAVERVKTSFSTRKSKIHPSIKKA